MARRLPHLPRRGARDRRRRARAKLFPDRQSPSTLARTLVRAVTFGANTAAAAAAAAPARAWRRRADLRALRARPRCKGPVRTCLA
eukprot:2799551-Pleurochrysis_carterae.AAC.4